MVLLGGLEVVAAGYLLNEFNKDKIEARERRKKRRDDDRPYSRPPRVDSQQSNYLQPPQKPPRPSSAPPNDPRPEAWQQHQPPPPPSQQYAHPPLQIPQHQAYQQPPQHSHLVLPAHQQSFFQPPSNNPYIQALHNDHTFPNQPAPWQITSNQYANQRPPIGPGQMQRPNTFHTSPQPQPQGPVPSPANSAQAHTFPVHQMAQPPVPAGGFTYIDTKTGRVSHNLYPPDHPMARGDPHGGRDMTREIGPAERTRDHR
ncbi:hypothetical protein LTR05_003401 [Lithohypha guttulata]|uniref:Uncharacterized protein n=1 Tax=Lithohypha guttulata TaxID=1690604 RepID=A0AAN7T5J4_9EURO|nr:hypothetical protein LTR05_003401 [Lithohypha guttulata]